MGRNRADFQKLLPHLGTRFFMIHNLRKNKTDLLVTFDEQDYKI